MASELQLVPSFSFCLPVALLLKSLQQETPKQEIGYGHTNQFQIRGARVPDQTMRRGQIRVAHLQSKRSTLASTTALCGVWGHSHTNQELRGDTSFGGVQKFQSRKVSRYLLSEPRLEDWKFCLVGLSPSNPRRETTTTLVITSNFNSALLQHHLLETASKNPEGKLSRAWTFMRTSKEIRTSGSFNNSCLEGLGWNVRVHPL